MKEFLAAIGIVITFASYVPYFRDIFAGKTKPHAFTWLIWSSLTAIAFFAQLQSGGGVGSLILGLTAIISAFIFLAALKVGKKNINRVDWYFLGGALLAMAAWVVTDDPLWSVIIVTSVDALAFAPTFRKAYADPSSETMATYVLSSVKFVVAIAALEAYTAVTVIYPLSLILANGLFVVMIRARRRQR